MILLKVLFILCLLLLFLILLVMFKDFRTLPDSAVEKGSLAWGILFALAWFIYLIYKITL